MKMNLNSFVTRLWQESKTRCIRNPLPEIELEVRQEVVAICERALIEIYGQRPKLGNVYLDESYKRYKVPFSQRTASKALETAPRGSKFKIKVEKNTLRNFVWWRNEENNRTDVDLSMTAYSETWSYITHISYTNLREERGLKGYHSGDIVDAPMGASEFIDIDLAFAKKSGVRYIVTSIQCFTGQKYCDLPECFMGWMNREKPNSGEIYEPKLVENKVDLSSSSPICIPYIIDLKEEVLIWADMMVTENLGRYMNIESNQEGILLACKSITKLNKPNLYDLIELHIKARGCRVFDKKEANYIFDEKDGIRPSQIELFMAEYL